MCTGDSLKSHLKNRTALNCLDQFKPHYRNQNRVPMLSEVKANVTNLKELFGRDAGSVVGPGHKQRLSSGGAAILMVNSHYRRPHLFSQFT